MNVSLILKPTNISNNEIFNLTISGKNMNLYDLKKMTVARQNGFVVNQIKTNKKN